MIVTPTGFDNDNFVKLTDINKLININFLCLQLSDSSVCRRWSVELGSRTVVSAV